MDKLSGKTHSVKISKCSLNIMKILANPTINANFLLKLWMANHENWWKILWMKKILQGFSYPITGNTHDIYCLFVLSMQIPTDCAQRGIQHFVLIGSSNKVQAGFLWSNVHFLATFLLHDLLTNVLSTRITRQRCHFEIYQYCTVYVLLFHCSNSTIFGFNHGVINAMPC